MDIGQFRIDGESFIGRLVTLAIDITVTIEPVPEAVRRGPDFKVRHNHREIGAAWRRLSRNGTAFISVVLDDPAFVSPIQAALFQPRDADPDQWPLVWERAFARD